MIEMNAKRMIGLVFFLVCFTTNILAQANQQPTLAANHEKIFIHFDRPYYTAGETIWFKAYLYNNGLPSMISNEFFLQLEDGSGKIISKMQYPTAHHQRNCRTYTWITINIAIRMIIHTAI